MFSKDQDHHNRHDVQMRERRNSIDDPQNHFSTVMSPTRFPVRAHVSFYVLNLTKSKELSHI